jgi:hypothetical protein
MELKVEANGFMLPIVKFGNYEIGILRNMYNGEFEYLLDNRSYLIKETMLTDFLEKLEKYITTHVNLNYE